MKGYEEEWRLLTMTQVQNIRKLHYEKGMNLSQISKETGRDRKTVKMYVEKEGRNVAMAIPSAPKESTFPKLEPFKAIIDQWNIEDQKAKRKQRHTVQRVNQECLFEALITLFQHLGEPSGDHSARAMLWRISTAAYAVAPLSYQLSRNPAALKYSSSYAMPCFRNR